MTIKKENTHLLFSDKEILISSNIRPIFDFLMNIETEIESLLGFSDKLEGVRENYLEILDFVSYLAEKLKENNIDFSYIFREDPKKIAENLNFNFPLRSQMIVLFASLEVLFSLHAAYVLKTSDDEVLRRHTMDKDNTKRFLNSFILNEQNEFFRENKERFSKIDSSKLRNLRNSLTHFFSVSSGGLSLAPNYLSQNARELEKKLKQNKQGHVVFISERDLYGLIKGGNILRMRKWSEDFQQNPEAFKEGIHCVNELVRREGSVILRENQPNTSTG